MEKSRRAYRVSPAWTTANRLTWSYLLKAGSESTSLFEGKESLASFDWNTYDDVIQKVNLKKSGAFRISAS